MKKAVLDFSKPFIAAYSKHPFANSDAAHPDYRFEYNEGHYWAMRVGELHIGWGVGAEKFRAYGTMIVERQNKNWLSIDMKGLPSTQIGDVCYYYLEDQEGFELVGFYPHLFHIYINPMLNELITDDMDETTFCQEVVKLSPENNKHLGRMVREHSLNFKFIIVENSSKKL